MKFLGDILKDKTCSDELVFVLQYQENGRNILLKVFWILTNKCYFNKEKKDTSVFHQFLDENMQAYRYASKKSCPPKSTNIIQ